MKSLDHWILTSPELESVELVKLQRFLVDARNWEVSYGRKELGM